MDTKEKEVLRQQAEKRLSVKTDLIADAPADVRRLIEELQVHQIELEIQNEELRRSQSELHMLQGKYFDLFENAPVGYVTLDSEGFILESNLTLAELVGVERRFLEKRAFFRSVAPLDQGRFLQYLERIRNLGLKQSIELRVVRPKGLFTDVLVEGIALEDVLDDMQIRLTITDISARVRNEEELEQAVEERTLELKESSKVLATEVATRIQSENKLARQKEILENILYHIPVILCFFDAGGSLQSVNRAFEEIIGWTFEETKQSDTMAECFPDPVYRQEAKTFLMESVDIGWRDLNVLCRDGKEREIAWARVLLSDGMRIAIGVDISERNRAERALRKSERSLSELSKRLIHVQEEERRSIALDLHDSIAAALSAIKLRLESVVARVERDDLADLKTPLDKTVSMIKQLNGSVRRLMTQLRPLMLDDLGLVPALRSHGGQFQEFNPEISFTFNADGVDEQMIPEHLKIVIFRIAQESLNNVSKHSRADRAWVMVNQQNHGLELEVGDNGNGFDCSAVDAAPQEQNGFGLSSMRERARLSGGVFSLESVPGKGTTVRAAWSL